jgi:di/tricarboxylate transporter
MTPTMLFLIVLVAGAAVLLITERLRPDLVALLLLVILGLSGIISADEMFAGFGRAAVITIMSLFIITAGLERTGVTRALGQQLGRLAGQTEQRAVLAIMGSTGALALVMNNIAAAAVLLPATVSLSRNTGLRPSRLLIPLAYASLLGGMATLFTTGHLVVSAVLVDAGFAPYGVFDFVPVGLPMALAGILFVALVGRRRLPQRRLGGETGPERPAGSLSEAYGMQQAVSAAYVRPGSPMAGLSLAEGQWGERLSLNVVGISRGANTNLAPQPREEILEGDIVLFTGITDDQELERYGLKYLDRHAWGGKLVSEQVRLVEVVLAPRSEFAGKTLRELRFREKYDVTVLAIWREGETLRDALAELPLRYGDALLIQGRASKLQLLRDEPGLLVLVEDAVPMHVPRKAWLAAGFTTTGVVLAATGVLPIAEAMFSVAVLMVLTNCLTMNEAYGAIEWRSIFLIAGMLPLGGAMVSTGTAAFLGQGLVDGLGQLGGLALAAGLFWAATLLTQVLSGQVTPVVLAPIAVASALAIGVDPRGMAMAVALGSSTAFLTPISHPSNLLVMGPGGYRFSDYARVGLPLTILLFVVMMAGLWAFWGIR